MKTTQPVSWKKAGYTEAFGKAIDARNGLERDFVSAAFSACCIGTANALDLAAIVPPDMITRLPDHHVWRAMVDVARTGAKPTPDVVWAHIHAARLNHKAGEEAYPDDLTAGHIAQFAISIFARSYDAVFFYANKMRAEGLKRLAEGRLFELLSDVHGFGNDPAEIASGLRVLAENLESGVTDSGDMAQLMERVISSLENGVEKPMPTPWPNLNSVLKGGLAKGELAILAARPGMGKTALATCMAVSAARSGIQTLFISREVKDITLGQRMIASEARIDTAFFRQGVEHSKAILPAIKAASSRLANLPLRVVEKSTAPMTPVEVRRLARATRGVGLIVVDYLQLLNPDTRQQSREREVAEMSRAMKQLALDCDCPLLLLSQLNRQAEEGNREPRLADLRESGAIEQDADIVMFLHARKPEAKLARMPVRVIVAKGRSSGTGSANLVFEKPFASFRMGNPDEMADDWNEQQTAYDNGF